jgi:predicted transcriptional regulator
MCKEVRFLGNRAIDNQKRMDISYALASEDTKTILNLLVNKITLDIDEVAKNITESDVLNVVCDLCKARLANLKGKKLIVTSLGLKVAKKLHTLND